MHLEARINRVWRYTWRLRWSELRDALGGRDRGTLEIHLQTIIERDWRNTWRWSIGGAPGAGTLFIG